MRGSKLHTHELLMRAGLSRAPNALLLAFASCESSFAYIKVGLFAILRRHDIRGWKGSDMSRRVFYGVSSELERSCVAVSLCVNRRSPDIRRYPIYRQCGGIVKGTKDKTASVN